jgi:hypothetical protein
MDPSSLDPSHGISFSSEVRSSFGFPVCSLSPDDASSFGLVVAFSRSKFRLSEASVGLVLQSVLGGMTDLFSVVEVECQLFKFSVLNRQVGLRIYALKSFACESFRPFFHLWNPNGLARDRISSTLDFGPHFDWESVHRKKSFASVVRNNSAPSRSVFSRLNFAPVPNRSLRLCSSPGKGNQPCSSPGKRNHPRSTLGNSFSNSFLQSDLNRPKTGPPPLSGANVVPLGTKSVPAHTRPTFSQCLSNFH